MGIFFCIEDAISKIEIDEEYYVRILLLETFHRIMNFAISVPKKAD